MTVHDDLLAILACPVSKLPLREEDGWLVCEGSGLKYPVREGIPVLLIEEARCLDGSEPDAAQLLVHDDSEDAPGADTPDAGEPGTDEPDSA